MNNAEIHAKIAAKVWPDEEVWVDSKMCIWREPCCIRKGKGERGSGKYFDLLETDSNGEPTTQAKSSALDVLVWLKKRQEEAWAGDGSAGWKTCPQYIWNTINADNPCEAIFNTAKEALDEG